MVHVKRFGENWFELIRIIALGDDSIISNVHAFNVIVATGLGFSASTIVFSLGHKMHVKRFRKNRLEFIRIIVLGNDCVISNVQG